VPSCPYNAPLQFANGHDLVCLPNTSWCCWCVGIGAAGTYSHVGEVCKGTSIARVGSRVCWWDVALDMHNSLWLQLGGTVMLSVLSNGG